MASTSTANPSTDIHYPLTVNPSMDIHSISNPSLSDTIISTLGSSFDEKIVISTLLRLSEGEKHVSESLGCTQEKGEVEGERPLISSELASEIEGSSLVSEEKGEDERARLVCQDEILMQKQRENERKTGTDAKTLKFAQELTEELIKDLGGVEGPELSTIPEGDEDYDFDAKSVDSAQQELDNISREPHEFTHPIPSYQVLASQTSQEAEKTLVLVHTKQSFRNAKANMASASTSAAVNSESDGNDFTYIKTEEEEEGEAYWVNTHFFPVEHVPNEYKSQAKRALKEPVVEDPTHKKLSSAFLENLKLQNMQYFSLHSDHKNIKYEIDSTKTKQKDLFDERLPALTMLNMDKNLKEESKIALRMDQLEAMVGKVEEKLLVHEAIKTNEILQKLLEAQIQTQDDNKKGDKDESSSKPQNQNQEEAIGPSKNT